MLWREEKCGGKCAIFAGRMWWTNFGGKDNAKFWILAGTLASDQFPDSDSDDDDDDGDYIHYYVCLMAS